MRSLRIDHIVYAVRDLDTAAALFADEHGLVAVAGGRHPGWGTENRIVALGGAYLELVQVADPERASANGFGRAIRRATERGDGLAGWAVATDELLAVAARLGLEVMAGARTRPDGSVLRWRLAGVEIALQDGALPFFISWDVPADEHPGAVGGATAPGRIIAIEIRTGKDRARAWLGDDGGLPLRCVGGPSGLSAVTISTPGGDVVLR